MKVQWPSACLGIGVGLLMSLWLPKDCKPCAATLVSASSLGRESSEHDARLTRLERELASLQSRRGSLLSGAHIVAGGADGAPVASLGASSSPSAPGGAKRQLWYWTDLVLDSLRPFERLNGGITRAGLRLAEQKCKISTWCHRAQVIDGRLFITDLRAIFFDRHYAMARVLPLLLTLQNFKLPDLDAVFSGTDYPIMELPRDAAHMHRMYGPGQPIPPLFSPTANSITLDLPWPDFSFFPPRGRCGKGCVHPLKTPRWQEAHPNLLELGKQVNTAPLLLRKQSAHKKTQSYTLTGHPHPLPASLLRPCTICFLASRCGETLELVRGARAAGDGGKYLFGSVFISCKYGGKH
jgi:hypothetical protein